MPLLAGSGLPLVEPGTPIVWSEDVGSITATWVDPTGVEYPLSNTADAVGYFTRPGPTGWGATSYEIVTDPQPRGGERVRFVRSQANRLVWPLHIWGETHLEFAARYSALRRAMLMTVWRQQPGVLRVARPDGTAREVDCFYESGWSGEGGENWLFANPNVTLFCPDGYWRDTVARVESRQYGALTASYLAPYPTVSTSQILGSSTVDNPGDVTAWPTWTLHGPVTQVTATSVDTGYTWTLTNTRLVNETVTLTTFNPTVRGPAGVNLASALNFPTAYLWGLMPGTNNITVSMSGSGAGSAFEMTYFPRYEGC